MKTSFIALLLCIQWARSSAECKPRGAPAPVNRTWFVKEMPHQGWTMPMIIKVEATSAATALAKSGGDADNLRKDYCVDIDVDGFPDITLLCEKKNKQLEQASCKLKPNGLLSLFGQHVNYFMVMTDNSTYVMITGCVGELDIWAVLGKSNDLPKNTKNEVLKKAKELGFKSGSYYPNDENEVKPKSLKFRKCKKDEEAGSGILGVLG